MSNYINNYINNHYYKLEYLVNGEESSLLVVRIVLNDADSGSGIRQLSI